MFLVGRARIKVNERSALNERNHHLVRQCDARPLLRDAPTVLALQAAADHHRSAHRDRQGVVARGRVS